MSRSSHYDYEAVIARIKERKNPKPSQMPKRSAGARPPTTTPSIWSRFKTSLRDEKKRLNAALAVIFGFTTWLGSTALAFYAQHTEAALAAACQQNHLAHAGSTYCFDERRIVHTLKDDGTTRRPGMDWRVNETAYRKAEAKAAREARHLQPTEP